MSLVLDLEQERAGKLEPEDICSWTKGSSSVCDVLFRFSQCLMGALQVFQLSPHSKNMHVRRIGNFKLTVGVHMSVDGY